MRILGFDQLTPSMENSRSLVHLTAFGSTFPPGHIELLRSRLRCFSDYVGVFAVDRGQVQGQVFVLRIPYRFREGPGTLSGIAAVGTNPDRGGGGIARALLKEVHRRERAAGIRYAALWTNRSWGAHNLYEELGYRDVYATSWVVRAPFRTLRRQPSSTVRRGRSGDLSSLDRLHSRLAIDRIGYNERPRGFFRTELLLGDLEPAKQLLVAHRRRELVGYARFDLNRSRLLCGEAVAQDAGVKSDLVQALGRAAGDRPCAFLQTWVTDPPSLVTAPGFASTRSSWYRMMGCDLERSWTEAAARRMFATDDPNFTCLAGDRF